VSVSINVSYDPNRQAVVTPGGRYRYQLCADDEAGEEDISMFTVWRRDKDDSWLVDMVIELDENMGPQTVFFPERRGKQSAADITEDYMRAAGHIWIAHREGLWAGALNDWEDQ
jgi:hypothetical protein